MINESEGPTSSRLPRAERMAALRTLVEASGEQPLSLWPALLSGSPVSTMVGPAGPTPMELESFLEFARRHNVPIVYGAYLDAGADDDLVSLSEGLVLQFPVAGGVVHCWTATHSTQPVHPHAANRATPAMRLAPPTTSRWRRRASAVDALGVPADAVVALNQLTYLRHAR